MYRNSNIYSKKDNSHRQIKNKVLIVLNSITFHIKTVLKQYLTLFSVYPNQGKTL